ncbi:DUF4383 domain-containing protein [Prauserella oleivorans]|uniref:DUF4383 domain-containing protein n=1 Tax=Prauserella oleivorans TaxID=1478153 RepID=A0ABW5WAQ2_9PSEU
MDRGTETRVRRAGMQPVQLLAGLVGLVYLALGIIGFVLTGFGDFTGTDHSTLLVFGINPLHNIVNLVVGVLGVLMALNSSMARTYGWLLFIGFGLLFVWGLAITGVFSSNPVSGLGNPLNINNPDNWLHLGTALVGLLIAVMPARKKIVQTTDTAGTAGMRPGEGMDAAAGRGQASPRRLWRRRGAAT